VILKKCISIQSFLKNLIENNSLKKYDRTLNADFSESMNKIELINVMNYLPNAIAGYKSMDNDSKGIALSNWYKLNVETLDSEPIYDRSAVALSTLLIIYALQIESFETIKSEYQKDQKDISLWGYVSDVGIMLATAFKLYFGGNLNTLNEIAPRYYQKYISGN
jgi:hypothetical protein